MDLVVDSLLSVSDCDSVIAQYEARIVQIKRRRNSLLPISCLHREIFHHILRLTLSQDWDGCQDPNPPSPFQYYATLFVLRQVSHGWEHELVNTPQFWTLISRLLSKTLQDLIWKRSGTAALEVDVSRDLSRANDFGFGSPSWSQSEKRYLTRMLTREIRQLRALVPMGENLDSHIVDHHHPRMKVLSLYGEHQIVCTRPLRAPQLEELYITHCKIIWDHLQNLRVLSVNVSNGPNLAQLVQILQSSPQLEQLSLRSISVTSDGTAVPSNPIHLPQLSAIAFSQISFELACGVLERLFTSAACRISDVSCRYVKEFAWSGFFHHAGRICTPQRPEQQIIDPQLVLMNGHLDLQTAAGRCLYTASFGNEQTIMRRVAEAARVFFERSKRPPIGAWSSRFRLQLQHTSQVSEGIEIVHELFPETVELDVVCEGLEGFEVLAEPMIEEGNPVWLLPNLAVLKLNTASWACDYGSIVAMAIKRMQAATSSPSALSPINSLTLGQGCVHVELLDRLKEAGITYQKDGVRVVF